MVSDILDMARLEAGRESLTFARFRAEQAISRAVLDIAPTAREKGVAVRVDVCAEATVEADPLAVERILITLMRNAVKFAPEGGEVSIGAAMGADLSISPSRITALESRRKTLCGWVGHSNRSARS